MTAIDPLSTTDWSQVVPGRAMVPREDAEVLESSGRYRELTAEELYRIHLAPHEERDADRDAPMAFLERFRERVAVFDLETDSPEETMFEIESLRDELCIDARPMFRFARFNHWGAMPGNDPTVAQGGTPESEFDVPGNPTGVGLRVYVIDSGLVESHKWENAPRFNSARVKPLSPADIATPAPGEVSHGTFVACVVGAVSRNSDVFVLEADLSRPPSSQPAESDVEELALAEAVDRVTMHAGATPAVLNMSFGAYPVFTRKNGRRVELRPLGLRTALKMMEEDAPDVVPVAAAGNQFPHPGDSPRLPYPAAFQGVTAVGAADDQGRWVLWEGGALVVVNSAATPRVGWAATPERLAPGVDILAPGGAALIEWSGSSFACAVQSGVIARQGNVVDATYADYPF